MIHPCNTRNYSIFRCHTPPIACFKDFGEDFGVDRERMAADPKAREWWAITDPMDV
jgi:L-rhamnose mutarotase